MGKRILWGFLMIPLIFSLLGVNTIQVTAAPATHDVAVVSITPDATDVEKGELVGVTVVVENQGDETETFDVTLYYDTTTIETKSVSSLVAGANTSLTFAWDTTDVDISPDLGSIPLKINATASTVTGETDTADNTLVSLSRVRVLKSPYIAVFPSSIVNPNLTIGETFTVSIKTNYTGTDVTGWQFVLRYNPYVLNGVSVVNGDLITTDKDPSAMFNPGTYDNTRGILSLTGAFFFSIEPVPVTSGPGTLANLTFEVVGEGDSLIALGLDIDQTKLKGYTEGGEGEPYNIINAFEDSRHAAQGYFRNTVTEVIHDIAVVSVTPNATNVEAGELVEITVEIKNNGTTTEDVTATVDRRPVAGGTPWLIGTQSKRNLAAHANASLTFIWNTSDVRAGKHIITAEAEPVNGETNIEDNTLQSPQKVTVRTLPEKPIPIELIIGIGVAVVVVVAVVTFVLRRGRKPISE